MLISLEELKTKVDNIFISFQKEEYGWNKLDDNDKLAALNNANIEFNRIQWIGKKATNTQEDAFPRLIFGEIVETPDVVKSAIAIYCMNWIRYMTDETIQELRKGVTGVHIGNYAETYKTNSEYLDINSQVYKKYLTGWVYKGNWIERR